MPDPPVEMPPPTEPTPEPPPFTCEPGAGDANQWVDRAPVFRRPADGLERAEAVSYGNIFYRSHGPSLVFLDGVAETDRGGCSWPQSFYANAVHEWTIPSDEIAVRHISSWGGGSYGSGCLRSSFASDLSPAPRHTYDGFAYVADEDAAYLMLGAYGRLSEGATSEALAELSRENMSTWRYSFASAAWERIGSSVRELWPSIYEVSNYEGHMIHWPEGDRLLFTNDEGNRHAEMPLSSRTWRAVERQDSPFSLYHGRSAWDSVRQRWVFRKGTDIGYLDPVSGTFTRLPDTDVSAGGAIAYIDRWDVYLIVGRQTRDTRLFDPSTNLWTAVGGDDRVLVPDDDQFFIDYDAANDTVGLVAYGARTATFRYVPEHCR